MINRLLLLCDILRPRAINVTTFRSLSAELADNHQRYRRVYMPCGSFSYHFSLEISPSLTFKMSLPTTKSILTISIARHLVGHGVNHVLDQAWSDVPLSTKSRFENTGFNLPVDDNIKSMEELKSILAGGAWDGIIVGWCIRSHPEFTELFELVVRECVDYICIQRIRGHSPQIMFCSGPNDLVNATMRTFPPPDPSGS